MRLLLTLLTVGALTACATSTSPDPWQGADGEPPDATRPIDCGSFPLPDEVSDDGVTYSPDGVRALEAYRQCSEANEAIAGAHADQIIERHRANEALIDAGRAQRRVAELRREILEEERRARAIERVQYWFLIAIFGIAAL